MNNIIVCIAKDEDNYIDEWIAYHLKLGFAEIFVYQNNWRYAGTKYANDNRVKWVSFDGEAMQLKAYNHFIDSHRDDDMDFVGFIDCDEFLCLKLDNDLPSFFNRYSDLYGIAVNWRCFGDNGLKNVINNEYSVIKRFTKCGKKLDRHVKTFLNMKKCKNAMHFVNPHFVDLSLKYDVIYDLDRNPVHGPWNYNCMTDIAQLNHYTCKTFEEFSAKFSRGKADTPVSHPQYNYVSSDFDKHNENDIEDLIALNFLNRNK